MSKQHLVLAALKPAYKAVIAEPENVFFEVFQNPENPGEFRFVENWNASVEWMLNVSTLGTIWIGRYGSVRADKNGCRCKRRKSTMSRMKRRRNRCTSSRARLRFGAGCRGMSGEV